MAIDRDQVKVRIMSFLCSEAPTREMDDIWPNMALILVSAITGQECVKVADCGYSSDHQQDKEHRLFY